MMDRDTLATRARAFHALHEEPRLLVLPNIWDPLGAQLLASLGYPSVATASAAVAFSLGHDDGERITFERLLSTVERIASAVRVPVTVDIESGYAVESDDVAENVRQLVLAGAVGINIEDSPPDGPLYTVEKQCDRIRAARAMAGELGVPLFINARTDVFLKDVCGDASKNLDEAIQRSKAYVEAGASGVYPISLEDMPSLNRLIASVLVPINVFASPSLPSMQELERVGVSRLSLGPGFLRIALSSMKRAAERLLRYELHDALAVADMTSADVVSIVRSQSTGTDPSSGR